MPRTFGFKTGHFPIIHQFEPMSLSEKVTYLHCRFSPCSEENSVNNRHVIPLLTALLDTQIAVCTGLIKWFVGYLRSLSQLIALAVSVGLCKKELQGGCLRGLPF